MELGKASWDRDASLQLSMSLGALEDLPGMLLGPPCLVLVKRSRVNAELIFDAADRHPKMDLHRVNHTRDSSRASRDPHAAAVPSQVESLQRRRPRRCPEVLSRLSSPHDSQ